MTAAPPRAPAVPLPPSVPLSQAVHADAATQQARRLRFTAVLGGFRARAAWLPAGSVRRRQGLQLCTAARLLTALGTRVEVVQPDPPWPRHRSHRILVGNTAGLLGDLALLIVVPRTTLGWADVADRVLPVRTTLRAVGPDDDVVDCPVTVAYRTPSGLAEPRTLNEVVAARGLVIEVRLLPALGAGARRAA
ncbi:hypothetical protein [Blastococcus deserti]|uniref:Uncharacterized protein n=1 Tax=Blastococcus deserti TaxID=2259033 RepID=A0ABW4XBB6_9ACTN